MPSDPIDDVNIGTALTLLGAKKEERPFATCPADGEPVVMTFEFPGAEFICVVCDRTYGFLSPKPAAPTPELEARYAELKAKYVADGKARAEAQS